MVVIVLCDENKYVEYVNETTTWMKMSAQGHPLVLDERQGNTYTTGQAATGPKTLLYIAEQKSSPIYSRNIKNKRNKTYRC